MKIFIKTLILTFCIPLFGISQSDIAKEEITNIIKKIESTPPYSCDISIKVDVKFIKIKERTGKMFYNSPEDVKYNIKGFAFLPKKEIGATISDLFKKDFIALELNRENNLKVIKIIPMDIESEIVTGQFWINENKLIEKMTFITKDKGSFDAEFIYNQIQHDLPSKIMMRFNVKNQEMPAILTGDLESYNQSTEEDEVSKGSITINYFNHKF